ncbi:hypothetical protein [Niallia sp. Krafla_26]|uniref:hypothetical protein n=1 Tax=Niallia sp. Krafla_26 TaxID=3064703 RepID=UPI003D172160
MRKKFTFILFVLLIAFLTACSTNESQNQANKNESDTKEEQSIQETEEQSLNVDKGLLNVEVTLPASFFEGQDIDTVIAEMEKEDIKITKNDDGSLTYKMSKRKHKEMMKDIGTSIDEGIEEMKSSEEYPSIKDITHNKDFTEFTLVVDKAAFENSFDGFAVLGLGLQGSMYQLFNGADPENYRVTISTKDEATQEVFSEVIYPDALEDLEEEQPTE